MLMNGYHDFPFVNLDYKNNMLIIQQPDNDTLKIVAGHDADVVLNAHCLHLEPTLTVDSTDNFTPKAGDTTGAVFGWYNKSIGINGAIGDTNFDKLILYKGFL